MARLTYLPTTAIEPEPSELVGPTRVAGRSPVLAILGSILVGAALALALVLGPASGGSEATITGCVLLAFGLGWGLMAFATTRFSTQPQRWMQVPAAGLGLTGLVLVVVQPDAPAIGLLSWVWPPALAALAIWIIVQARRHLRGRGRWLVYPVVAVLVVCSIGGALATVIGAVGKAEMPPTGRMVDVGGRALYIECHGTGSPVVVLQAGLGRSAADWS